MSRPGLIGKVVLWGLVIVSVVLCVLVLSTIKSNDDPGGVAEMWISVSLYWAMFLIIAASMLAIGFSLSEQIVRKKKKSKKAFYIVAFVLVLLVSYLMSSGEIPQFYGVEKFVNDGSLTKVTSKLIGAGLIAAYLFFGLAVLLLLGFGLRKSLNRN